MSRTFAQKALARAAGLVSAEVGQIVDARPDVILSHDNTAAIARLFAGLGIDRVTDPDRLAIVLDHAVPAPTAEHARNHAEVRTFVAAQGVRNFFDAGRGICHQVVGEEALILPGQLILGADSHTTHLGWLGAFGAGIGRSEVAALWATGALWLRVPETIRIDLHGELSPGVTAKDLSLWLLRLLGDEAGIYRALEFGGPGLRSLSVESRMVLPNMMAESGAKNAYLEPDDAIFDWLAPRLALRTGDHPALSRERIVDSALMPDPDAPYLQRHVVDLAAIEPVVARPHHPADVVPLSAVAGTRVHQAFIGTCTNGRLEDLAAAAAVFRTPDGGVRRVAPSTRLVVIPASAEVLRSALAAGYVDTFLSAGAMLGVPGCGPCMGNHLGIPASGETVISSANRNFRGRMGNPEAEIYLAGPAVVAASAVLGYIAHPGELLGGVGSSSKNIAFPVKPAALEDDTTPASLTTAERQPSPLSPGAVVSTGPEGRAWRFGDNVNTDVIFPGKYTYTVREEAEMARHAFEDLDPKFAAAVRPGDVIVAGLNFGCGSSREQAVVCLRAAGVRVVVASSFARIYFRNAVNNGLLPVVCPEAVAAIRPGEQVSVDAQRCVVRCEAGEFPFPPLSPSVSAIMEAGGLLETLKPVRSEAVA